jgi:hypothetical protein
MNAIVATPTYHFLHFLLLSDNPKILTPSAITTTCKAADPSPHHMHHLTLRALLLSSSPSCFISPFTWTGRRPRQTRPKAHKTHIVASKTQESPQFSNLIQIRPAHLQSYANENSIERQVAPGVERATLSPHGLTCPRAGLA